MDTPDTLPPPVYTATSTGYVSKETAPPPSYYSKIGNMTIGGPLVTVPELKAHLRLLKAFSDLKQRVDNMPGTELGLPATQTDAALNWPLFVALAVERFERFCLTLTDGEVNVPSSDNASLPPLDVFMVWHAYLLNPLRYAEDTDITGSVGRLKELGRILDRLESVVSTLTTPPSGDREDGWTKKTGLAFDPFQSAKRLQQRAIRCPKCAKQSFVPLVDENGRGYLQHDFAYTCRSCGFAITKDTLAVEKLVKDLTTDNRALPGTYYTLNAAPDFEQAMTIKRRILLTKVLARPKDSTVQDWRWNIKMKQDFTLAKVKAAMSVHMKGRGALTIRRIMNAYTDDRIFSLDLVGAVIRQESFVHKMNDLRWTSADFFEDPEDKMLLHAIARYHAFLDLMSSSPASFFVPTLDIDLAWHTHQLRSVKYNIDCFAYVERFVDHNDRVEEDRLSNAFDITCRAWEDRFHVRYTHCGCPAPGDKVSQRLSRFLKGTRDAQAPSELIPPADRSDLLGATHPSDHNAVYAFSHSGGNDAARERRRQKYEKRLQREKEKGDLDEKRRGGHDPAFLMPLPLYYAPIGCVAATGLVVGAGGGTAACAAGVGGCGGKLSLEAFDSQN